METKSVTQNLLLITWNKTEQEITLNPLASEEFKLDHKTLYHQDLNQIISNWEHIAFKIEKTAHDDWSITESTDLRNQCPVHIRYKLKHNTIQVVLHFSFTENFFKEFDIFKSLLSNTPVHIFKLDENQVIDFINHTAPGTSQSDFIGKKLVSTLPKDGTREKVQKILDLVWTNKSTEEYQISYPTEYGVFIYNTIVHPIIEQNKVIGATFISLDVTKEEELQKKLKREETINQLITDRSLNGIYIFDLKKGKNEFINSQYTQLLGYTLEDINTMGQEEFLSLFHPDEKPEILSHMQEISQLKPDEFSKIEYRFKCKDGSWKWLLSKDSGFTYAPDGTLDSFIGSFVDITDLKQNAVDLKTQKQELNRLLKQKNNILEVINQFSISAKLDPIGRITEVNDNFLDIFDIINKSEIIGTHILSFNKKIDLENMFIFYEKVKKNITKNQNFVGQVQIKIKNQNLFFNINVMPNFFKGRLTSIHVIAHDITQRVLEEKKDINYLIKQQDQEREKLAFQMHEGLAQNLAGLNFQLQYIEEIIKSNNSSIQEIDQQIATARSISNQTLNETIKIASQVMPRDIVSLGLIYAIQQLLSSYKKQLTLFDIDNTIEHIYTNKSTEISIYRFTKTIIDQLLKNNTAKLRPTIKVVFRSTQTDQIIDIKIISNKNIDFNQLFSTPKFKAELGRLKINNVGIQEIKDLLSESQHISITFPILKEE